MTRRREFSVALKLEILKKATDSSGRVHCQGCGVWMKSRKAYEFDHLIPEGMRTDADKKRRLVAADGQLLCIQCHQGKKTRRDKGNIAGAKRMEAAALGIKKPGTRPWGAKKEPKPLTKVAIGPPGIARRFGRP